MATSSLRMLAIDPGIDIVAGAIYDLSRRTGRGGSIEHAARAFEGVVQHRTSPRDEAPDAD